jgi:NHL repeat
VHNICADVDRWFYVTDRENHRVQVFEGFTAFPVLPAKGGQGVPNSIRGQALDPAFSE